MAEDTTGLYAGAVSEKKPRSFLVDLTIRLVREKPLGTVGAVIVLTLLLVGIFAHWLAPYGYNETWVGGRLESSSWEHWVGTDQSGRDLFSRVTYGARISMYVGLGVSGFSPLSVPSSASSRVTLVARLTSLFSDLLTPGCAFPVCL